MAALSQSDYLGSSIGNSMYFTKINLTLRGFLLEPPNIRRQAVSLPVAKRDV